MFSLEKLSGDVGSGEKWLILETEGRKVNIYEWIDRGRWREGLFSDSELISMLSHWELMINLVKDRKYKWRVCHISQVQVSFFFFEHCSRQNVLLILKMAVQALLCQHSRFKPRFQICWQVYLHMNFKFGLTFKILCILQFLFQI